MTMNSHNIRVDDELWQRAAWRAADDGVTLSKLIRQWLTDYADHREVLPLTETQRKALREILR